ncbi:pyrimidine 5'-nucleotidase [Sphingomonas nostoxanthinifaciens]|uniref:pyrimidine 5'-nucleotidase n=1 Tax=Sphingomonas nostoxanthinifaciens TaxID=2872652 RepID=UPI001CC1F744|nr:pyrimidine 5'-nucleotidase [Sphingomonas nostoxanthinifaciens]UAK23594.1 pyrimidine 5'-nucleotidase [Sphingomonas nostoxanthinifaciens]
MVPALAHIDAWIFDLDNTLYPASCDLFGLIDQRMTAYVAQVTGLPRHEAYALQKRFFREHGTTLAGLSIEYDVDPHEFLADVHAIELDALSEDRRLIDALARLPGRKLVFTNGDAPYARRVLDRLGLSRTFEAIHDIHACGLRPKPDPHAYASMLASFRIEPTRALFAEDMARNLKPAKALGMTTLWVDNGSEQAGDGARDHIDYVTADLGAWLHALTETTGE